MTFSPGCHSDPSAVSLDPISDTPLFELNGAGFKLAERTLFDPLTLDLRARKVIGVIGRNGSGKSTLVKLLARQQPASVGVIRFKGIDLQRWSNRPFARKVAYLPQQTPLAPAVLVRELVAFGRYPWHGALGRFGALDKDKVSVAMRQTGTEVFADRLVDTLSGGERQRTWLAMLLAQDTECLLLDEPTSALDIAHQIEVLSLVCRLCHERGLGVVMVLHDMNMAARFCDEIIALQSGRVVVCGPPKVIMTPMILEKIYGVSMGVTRCPETGRPISYPR
ncbi:ATP-binding cassette domain-containing protein [Bradyrhizobium sp. CCGUVB1N3]|uniref:ABC transporter ATP-binding protein n=1 Tax=Bradyrhizobium sp. CCGUVB1N3 TaxID=2949629 RepID=UPI0020B3538E|nr:ATP-binding cassette domain-containing protein [Bradyrhizobium sp. CCGUVB1N3]MCP3469101.1 ATP-binding cassette domain-containing protein [Bradyrhizobium sp. CCGUVB1N3]